MQIVAKHQEEVNRCRIDNVFSTKKSIIMHSLQMSYRESCKTRHLDTNKALLHEINLLDKREAIVPINRKDT